MNLTLVGRTHTGKVRQQNEDRIWLPPDGVHEGQPALLIVADGMGGHQSGEVASAETVDRFVSTFFAAEGDPGQRLRRAVDAANSHVWALSESDQRYQGMGSTLVAAVVEANRAWVCHVGDSRCYLIRGGRPLRVTADHSWVAEEVRAGRMSERTARTHPRRNLITRGIGAGPSVEPDISCHDDVRAGDILLLCSDGLTSVVDDREIAQVASHNSPRETVDRLIELANQRGGPDNVSVVLAHVEGAGDDAVTIAIRRRRRRGNLVIIGAVMGVALAAGLLSGYVVAQSGGNGGTPLATNAATQPSSPVHAGSSPAAAVATVAIPTGTCVDGSPAEIYTVEPGDTLSALAQRRGLHVGEIQTCDGRTASETDLLAGAMLRIPAAPVQSAPAGGNATATPTAPARGNATATPSAHPSTAAAGTPMPGTSAP